jgi:hypothetical protein
MYIKNQPFVYVSRIDGNLAAGTTANLQLTIANDTDFLLEELRTTSDTNLRILVSNSNGEQWSNGIFNSSLVGVGNNGKKFFHKVLIPKNTTLQITFQNVGGVAVVTPEIQFWGVKTND